MGIFVLEEVDASFHAKHPICILSICQCSNLISCQERHSFSSIIQMHELRLYWVHLFFIACPSFHGLHCCSS